MRSRNHTIPFDPIDLDDGIPIAKTILFTTISVYNVALRL